MNTTLYEKVIKKSLFLNEEKLTERIEATHAEINNVINIKLWKVYFYTLWFCHNFIKKITFVLITLSFGKNFLTSLNSIDVTTVKLAKKSYLCGLNSSKTTWRPKCLQRM